MLFLLLGILLISALKIGLIVIGLVFIAVAIYFFGYVLVAFRNPIRYKCPFCNEVFICGEGYITHIAHAHGPVVDELSGCERVFSVCSILL